MGAARKQGRKEGSREQGKKQGNKHDCPESTSTFATFFNGLQLGGFALLVLQATRFINAREMGAAPPPQPPRFFEHEPVSCLIVNPRQQLPRGSKAIIRAVSSSPPKSSYSQDRSALCRYPAPKAKTVLHFANMRLQQTMTVPHFATTRLQKR